MKVLGLILITAFLAAADAPSAPAVAEQIAADMMGKHEGSPHGVPASYGWATAPVVVMGNQASGWRAITAWGAIYETAEGTRLAIRG